MFASVPLFKKLETDLKKDIEICSYIEIIHV